MKQSFNKLLLIVLTLLALIFNTFGVTSAHALNSVEDVHSSLSLHQQSSDDDDDTPPDAPIVTAPPAFTNDTTPTISGTAGDDTRVNVWRATGLPSPDDWELICKNIAVTESGDWSCVSIVTLPEGFVELRVNATDEEGNRSPYTHHSFTVTGGIAGPDTQINSQPPNPSNSANATFTFSSTDATATFECQLDNSGFSACTSPQDYTGLADGSHIFEVRATDAAGNVDPTPASYIWTVNTSGSSGPEIQVLHGLTDIPDGTGIVNFGSTPLGTPVTRTFTVMNNGTADLTLTEPISVPSGFSLISSFGSLTLAPAASTSFQVGLDAVTSGSFSGEVSFGNGDADENPFNFTISGPVAAIEVYIGGNKLGNYNVPPTSTLFQNYSNTLDGPMKVVSTDGTPFFTSHRALYGNGFNELIGYPANQLTTEYWFPWYDDVTMETWIHVGNPDATNTANVEIYIGGQLQGSFSIPPNGRIAPMFSGLLNGPVRVVCTNCASYGGTIFTSERSLGGDSFNELAGYPANQFTTEYWFPWYDNVSMRTWILVGNPSATDTAYVDIFIGGVLQDSYTILPNGRIIPMFPSVMNGPVQVVSTTGAGTPTALPIFTSERSLYGDTFNEIMGYPKNQFTTEYFFPWYDNSGSMESWILVGNPSATQTAYVEIYIGGALQLSTSIAPNGRITPTFPVNTGPVRVLSTTGAGTPTALPIFTSERSLYLLTSFNETMGYAANRLTSEYWFNWYDNIYMNTDVLISRP